MDVAPGEAAGFSRVGDTVYYFCSSHCKKRFDADPSAFAESVSNPLSPRADEAPSVTTHHGQSAMKSESTPKTAAPAVYTCPMHPEVRSDRPGSCPKCGIRPAGRGDSNRSDK